MKKIFLFLLITQNIIAQKYDNNWMIGSNWLDGAVSKVTFENETIKCEDPKPIFNLSITSTTMSDKDGNLLFFTNGIEIANRNYTILKNSENFNSSKYHDGYKQGGLAIAQAVLPLPHAIKKKPLLLSLYSK